MFWCDNRCSEEALRFWQFASVVVDDGEEAHTINLCQQCYNERLTAQGQALLKSWQWKAVVELKAHRGRLWKMLGKDQFIQGMWEYFLYKECGSTSLLKKSGSKKVSEECRERKSRKGYKANGNASLLPKNFWIK